MAGRAAGPGAKAGRRWAPAGARRLPCAADRGASASRCCAGPGPGGDYVSRHASRRAAGTAGSACGRVGGSAVTLPIRRRRSDHSSRLTLRLKVPRRRSVTGSGGGGAAGRPSARTGALRRLPFIGCRFPLTRIPLLLALPRPLLASLRERYRPGGAWKPTGEERRRWRRQAALRLPSPSAWYTYWRCRNHVAESFEQLWIISFSQQQ